MSIEDRHSARANPPVARHKDIACRGENAEQFFPRKGQPTGPARKICGRCPHQDECLAWALETGQRHGIWAGTSPEQRVAIWKQWERAGAAVHLIRHDQAATTCCGRTPAELPHADGHRLTIHRDRATCPALITAEHLELP